MDGHNEEKAVTGLAQVLVSCGDLFRETGPRDVAVVSRLSGTVKFGDPDREMEG